MPHNTFQYQTVLLIDDDEDDQEIFRTALSRVSREIACTAMNDAAMALAKLKTTELNPEVIFLDLNMPRMSGLQFLVELKKTDSLKHLPVVIFSTSSHPPTIALSKELGAMQFMTKPNQYEDLIQLLKTFFTT